MNISLIANSGIQFHKFRIEINLNDDVIRTMGFYEYIDLDRGEISLEYAYKVPNTDMWAAKKQLINEEYLDRKTNKFIQDVNPNTIIPLNDKHHQFPEYFRINDIQECLEHYENIWLPFPYFKQNKNKESFFGPVAWTRIMLKNITPEKYKKSVILYEVVLAFDTKVDDKNSTYFTPRNSDTNIGENIFGISTNEDHNLNFCNPEYKCGWVNEYLLRIRYDGELPDKFPSSKYLGEYLYLVKYLSELENFYLREKFEKELIYQTASNVQKKEKLEKEINEINKILQKSTFPEVTFYSDEQAPVDVDLVLDIGNSNTCGLLFESPATSNKTFNFNSVKKLKIHDLTDVGTSYNDPFSMRLAFAKAQFGDIDIPEYQKSFHWPSLLRVGKEAQRLINLYNIDVDRGTETATNNSSPKRYLWDNKKSEIPWEFVNIPTKSKVEIDEDEMKLEVSALNEQAYYEGISEQFRGDGEYTFEKNSSVMPNYSRKSLMTFVYIETFLHALTQINSHKFREDNDGAINKPRRIRRVTITCPTAIVQKEQVILRECALEAATALSRYDKNAYNKNINAKDIKIGFEIIPAPKELAKDLSDTRSGEKEDWIYDEATCNQLVFLYAEISERYLNNCKAFFELYGKKRNDVDEPYQESITIGTVDIGGGTTDLMIAAYEYAAEQSNAVIKPKPLYWESFTKAGDDLLKELVKQIVLEGDIDKPEHKGCKGVIKNYAVEKGCKRVTEKMQNFFGHDTNKQNYIKRIYRKNFNVQIAIPIALRFLQHASSNDTDKEITFDEIFVDSKPNPELIKFVNQHFGNSFNFEDIKWKLSRERVSEIIDTAFDDLFKKLSILMSAYGCDFVLLSGKPTTIPKIREMFIKYYPVSPDRIISLNTYRVGRWYPNFGDEADEGDLGYLKEPKTVVSVGAIISLMGGKLDKLSGFKINNEYLIKDLTPTTEYIGAMDTHTGDIKVIYLSPDENKNTITISGLPVIIGYKRLSNKTYPGRPIYKLEFNEKYLRKKISYYLNSNNEIEVMNAIEKEKYKVKKNMPLKIKLSRRYRESKEILEITSIKDRTRDELSENTLSLSLMTLPDEAGYWLDTGEFILNIK